MYSTAPARVRTRRQIESAQVAVSCYACQQTADGYVCAVTPGHGASSSSRAHAQEKPPTLSIRDGRQMALERNIDAAQLIVRAFKDHRREKQICSSSPLFIGLCLGEMYSLRNSSSF